MRVSLIILLCWMVTPLSAAVILQYHHVSENTPAATSVTPEQFARHLDKLEQEGFQVLPLERLVERVREGVSPRDKLAAITFDDGYRTVHDTAIPMLEKRGWHATVFVTTDGIQQGWQEMMTPAMLADLQARGHQIANHTASHPHLVRRRDNENRAQWLERIKQEITAAQSQLETWLPQAPPRWLAYPYGEYSPEVEALLGDMDFIGFTQQTGALGALTDWQAVPRIPVNRHYADWQSLGDKVRSLPLPVTGTRPDSGITDAARPELVLTLDGHWRERGVNCFAAGQAMTPQWRDAGTLVLRAPEPLSAGRQRYTCTAPAGEGRFYWYSWMWLHKAGGQWYAEP
jgi:biofilm PGA synthesis lipoprotein PgaB